MTDSRMVLGTAAVLGFPRVEVIVPGRQYPVAVEASRQGWSRFLSFFGRDAGALQAALQSLVIWECELLVDWSDIGVSRAA